MNPEDNKRGNDMNGAMPEPNNGETITTAEEVVSDGVKQADIREETVINTAPAQEATVVAEEATVMKNDSSDDKVNFFQAILQTFTKPITMLREDLPKFGNAKNAVIMAIIALAASVLTSVLSVTLMRVFSFYCSSYSGCSFDVDFEDFGYIFKNGDIFLGLVLVAIINMLVAAGVFFGVAKLMKLQAANFWRTLTVVSLAMLPMVLIGFISSIIGIFLPTWSIYIMLLGLLCSAVVFYEGMIMEAHAESDKKYYYIVLATVLTLVALALIMWLIGDKLYTGGFMLLDI